MGGCGSRSPASESVSTSSDASASSSPKLDHWRLEVERFENESRQAGAHPIFLLPLLKGMGVKLGERVVVGLLR